MPEIVGSQLWALDERRGLLRKAPTEPVQLTSGPIQWSTPIFSKDGKKIFARGVVLHGELLRFDAKSKELKPYLEGISAEFVTFSPDGENIKGADAVIVVVGEPPYAEGFGDRTDLNIYNNLGKFCSRKQIGTRTGLLERPLHFDRCAYYDGVPLLPCSCK